MITPWWLHTHLLSFSRRVYIGNHMCTYQKAILRYKTSYSTKTKVWWWRGGLDLTGMLWLILRSEWHHHQHDLEYAVFELRRSSVYWKRCQPRLSQIWSSPKWSQYFLQTPVKINVLRLRSTSNFSLAVSGAVFDYWVEHSDHSNDSVNKTLKGGSFLDIAFVMIVMTFRKVNI